MQFYEELVLDNDHTYDDDVRGSLLTKITRFNNIIQSIYIYINECKRNFILKVNDVKICSNELKHIRSTLGFLYSEVQKFEIQQDDIVSKVQKLNVDMSNIIKKWGTKRFDDFMYVCFGKEYKNTIIRNISSGLLPIIEKQFHPLRYTMFSLDGPDDVNIVMPDLTLTYTLGEIRKMNTFDCFNVSNDTINGLLYIHVNGMVLFIKNEKMNAGMFVYGTVDHIDINLANSQYINTRYTDCIDNIPSDIDKCIFTNFLHCISTRDWLIHNSAIKLYAYYKGGLTEHKIFKQQTIISMSNDFISKSIYTKRQTLVYFLLDENDIHSKYIAYFLYDLITLDTSSTDDSREQTEIMNSFTWKLHELFNNSLVETLQYTTKLNKVDSSKINIEQQICLMKTDDTVKEKAMVKLREVKSKSDDGGSKARHYLDGILKIPFGNYRKEPILDVSQKIKEEFESLAFQSNILSVVAKNSNIKKDEYGDNVPVSNYTVADIRHIIDIFYMKYRSIPKEVSIEQINIYNQLLCLDKKSILQYIDNVNTELETIRTHGISGKKYQIHNLQINIKKPKQVLVSSICQYLKETVDMDTNETIKRETIKTLLACLDKDYIPTCNKMIKINKTFNDITSYLSNVNNSLDKAVHGHNNAKNQLIRIIGQWINGEHSGYCFGFEGPAGVGKTSLCKNGLANCLVDGDDKPRPFAMIAMGGDSNGSTLHGHNYTYVGSTWGSIVDILMDKGCMNPIIFIDELDKISKTEHGRELVGILIHMLDTTQNDKFQDKYFAGIDIDLSKVLFVLSYNDADSIDRILLDRIHRVKFSSLSLDEKIHISKKYTLPEIYKKNGLEGSVNIGDDVIRYIIENYTCEPGVRKLKEKLFEIVSEINIRMLKRETMEQYPLNITIEDVKTIYFKDMRPVSITMVPNVAKIGYANGLWANAHGQGGTLPIEAYFYPTNEFLRLKLTGKQGDVMQESMNVALTLAYKLCPKERLNKTVEQYNGNIKYGIHVHTPEGATPKDGPSAGSCITTVIYSLLSNLPIKPKCGMTGEIQLTGSITAIGGLDAKILGSLKSGINTYFYPQENDYDFNKFYEKYKDKEEIQGITFYAVSNIEELLDKIIEK